MQGGAHRWDGGGVGTGPQQWAGGGVGVDEPLWGRGGMGGGEPLWGGGGMGGGKPYLDGGDGVQEGGVPGRPEPEGGGAYQGRQLSSTIDSQAPASSEQQVEWPPFSSRT